MVGQGHVAHAVRRHATPRAATTSAVRHPVPSDCRAYGESPKSPSDAHRRVRLPAPDPPARWRVARPRCVLDRDHDDAVEASAVPFVLRRQSRAGRPLRNFATAPPPPLAPDHRNRARRTCPDRSQMPCPWGAAARRPWARACVSPRPAATRPSRCQPNACFSEVASAWKSTTTGTPARRSPPADHRRTANGSSSGSMNERPIRLRTVSRPS